MTPQSNSYDWDEPYRLAVLETDPRQLMSRVSAAKSAIEARMTKLSGSADDHFEELKNLYSALKIMQLLTNEAKNEKAGDLLPPFPQ